MCFHKNIRDFQIYISFIYKSNNKLENTRCHLLYMYVKQSIIGISFIANIISILTIVLLKKKIIKYVGAAVAIVCRYLWPRMCLLQGNKSSACTYEE